MENNTPSPETIETGSHELKTNRFNRSSRPEGGQSPVAVMAICFSFFVAGNIIGYLVMYGLAAASGVNLQVAMTTVSENSPIETRNFMRGILFLNHLFSFILPAVATAVFYYKKLWVNYLKLDTKPEIQSIFLGIVWFVVSMPFVQMVYQFNQTLKLPQWIINLENDASQLMAGILTQNHFYEIVLNVFLIGVIPAIGEEMIFRGIVQQQIGRLLKNEHVVVWVSAAIFSAIHMQFQGFLGRVLLGVLLGYIFVWTRNLWVAMALHLFNNSAQIIYIYAKGIKPSEMDKLSEADKMPLWLGFVSMLAAIGLGLYIQKWHSFRIVRRE